MMTLNELMTRYEDRYGEAAAIDPAATKAAIAWLEGRIDAEQRQALAGAELALHRRHRGILTALKRADRLYELLAAEGVL